MRLDDCDGLAAAGARAAGAEGADCADCLEAAREGAEPRGEPGAGGGDATRRPPSWLLAPEGSVAFAAALCAGACRASMLPAAMSVGDSGRLGSCLPKRLAGSDATAGGSARSRLGGKPGTDGSDELRRISQLR